MAEGSLEAQIFGDGAAQEDDLPEEFKTMSAEDVQRRCVPPYCDLNGGQRHPSLLLSKSSP
jgi:hypothetical protein